MAPITFSKNQFDVLADVGNGKSSLSAPQGELGASPCAKTTFEELTKDLMTMDDNENDSDALDLDGGDDLLPTQELDWNFDPDEEGAKESSPKDSDDDDDDDLHMDDEDGNSGSDDSPQQNDSTDDEVEANNTSPSAGRKKATISPNKEATAKEEEGAPSADDSLENPANEDSRAEKEDAEETEEIDDDGEGSGDEDDSDDDDDDDKTVAMSEEEGTINIKDAPKSADDPTPTEKVLSPADDGEYSDAWLDGSDEEGKKWREKAAQPSDNEESDDDEGEEELEIRSDHHGDDEKANSDNQKEPLIADNEASRSLKELSAETPRRSVRARKPRKIYSEENKSSSSKPKKKRIPAKIVWTAALDQMYAEVDDKKAVTVKQLRLALSKQFECKMSDAWKAAIKDRLRALVNGDIKPTKKEDREDTEDTEEEDADDEASAATDPGQDGSDYEDDAKSSRSKRKARRARLAGTNSTKKKSPQRAKRSERKAARAAKMIEMQKLRRKQLLEEKVRNEEMQLNQNKEDIERAEAIAAKFETNTDELRLKRLEDRLDLLQQLDQKRISVIEIKDDTANKLEPVVKEEPLEAKNEKPMYKEEPESEESSSEEEDLVIVGIKKPLKPLKPLQNHLPSTALDLLNGIRSPEAKKYRARQSKALAFASGPNKVLTSPGKSMGARFALRNALRQKQRKMGNLWLARELGYKREEDHVKDCMTAAEQKRELVIKLEQERQKANERKNLRERLLLQEAGAYDDIKEEAADTEESPAEGEEDEELLMAKEIEKETQEISHETLESEMECERLPSDASGEDMASSDARIEMELRNEMSVNLETQPPENTDVEPEQQEQLPPALETQPPEGIQVEPLESQELEKSLAGGTLNDDKTTQEPSLEPKEQAESEQIVPMSFKDESQDPESQFLETQPPLSLRRDDACIDAEIRNELHGAGALEDIAVISDQTPLDELNEEGGSEGESEAEFKEGANKNEEGTQTERKAKNSMWQEALRREAEKLKKQKARKGGLVEEEAEEEEEEEVAGLEDFGFTVSKKKKDDDDEEDDANDELDEEDLKHIVDEVSDNEGDEDAGMAARRKLEAQEEKRLHKEFMRRTREGHDGRRGGIAGGSGARGLHGFDQLVAPDNREDAKRLGLLNDDELDSEDEKEKKSNDDEEEDETALLDQEIRRRHLHQSDVNLEDELSSSEDEEELEIGDDANTSDIEEEVAQRRLNKLFKKRATMKDYERLYGHNEEFSQQRLIDEDTSMKEELKRMRNGLVRRRSISSSISQGSQSSNISSSQYGMFGPPSKRQRGNFGSIANRAGGSLSVALLASRTTVRKTSFLGGSRSSSGCAIKEHSQSVSSGQFLFNSQSQSRSNMGSSSNLEVSSVGTKRKFGSSHASTLFSRVVGRG